MTLALEDYDDDIPSSVATPTSWLSLLYDLPVVRRFDDAFMLKMFDYLAGAREYLPAHNDVHVLPMVAMFRDDTNNAWLLVQLDQSGVGAQLIQRSTRVVDEATGETEVTVRYFYDFWRGQPYSDRLEKPPFDVSAFDETRQLAIFMGVALGLPCAPGTGGGLVAIEKATELSEHLVGRIERLMPLSLLVDAALRIFAANEFVAVVRTLHDVTAPSRYPTPNDPLRAPETTRLIRAAYPAVAQRRTRAFALLLSEALFDCPVVACDVFAPLSWLDFYQLSDLRDVVQWRALQSTATSVADLLYGVHAVMASLRVVLGTGSYTYVLRVTGAPNADTPLLAEKVRRRLSDAEPLDGILLITPTAIELYQVFRCGSNHVLFPRSGERRVMRQYTVTPALIAKREMEFADDDDIDGTNASLVDVARGAHHVQLAPAEWGDTFANALRARHAHEALGLLQPLENTLRRMDAGTERTEGVLAAIGLLAVARWLVDVERGGDDDERRAAAAQLAGYTSEERRMVKDAKRYLFT